MKKTPMQALKIQLERQIKDSVTDTEQLYLSGVVNLITKVYEPQEKKTITLGYEKGVNKGVEFGLELKEIPTDNSLSEKYYNETFKNE